MRYATVKQMQNMDFGVHGTSTLTVHDGEKLVVEFLGNDELGGWAVRFNDADGNLVDHDFLYEDEARELGLIP